jgi:hypothetical protein
VVDQPADCDTYNAVYACTNVFHVLAEGLGMAILRTCTNNGAINSFGVEFMDGRLDGWCRAWPQGGRISDTEGPSGYHWGGTLKASTFGEGDEGNAPPFNYTLAFAIQLRKIMENLSLQWWKLQAESHDMTLATSLWADLLAANCQLLMAKASGDVELLVRENTSKSWTHQFLDSSACNIPSTPPVG